MVDGYIDIVLSQPPGPHSDFVEVEVEGKGIRVGEWMKRPDGLYALRLRAFADTRGICLALGGVHRVEDHVSHEELKRLYREQCERIQRLKIAMARVKKLADEALEKLGCWGSIRPLLEEIIQLATAEPVPLSEAVAEVMKKAPSLEEVATACNQPGCKNKARL